MKNSWPKHVCGKELVSKIDKTPNQTVRCWGISTTQPKFLRSVTENFLPNVKVDTSNTQQHFEVTKLFFKQPYQPNEFQPTNFANSCQTTGGKKSLRLNQVCMDEFTSKVNKSPN